jgi:hypothetical protein
MAILLKPQAIVETISRVKLVRERPWLGVYHIAAGRLTLARLFHSPFNDQTQLYRSRYLEHSFLRDEQALDGRSIEIILERFKVHEPTSEEVTAVLVEQPGWTNYGGQTIVMKDETGEWVEPPVNQDCPERDFNLAVLMQLAERVKPVSVAQSQR